MANDGGTPSQGGTTNAPSPSPPRGDPSGLAGGVRASDRRGPRLGLRIRFNDETTSGVYVHKETNVFALT